MEQLLAPSWIAPISKGLISPAAPASRLLLPPPRPPPPPAVQKSPAFVASASSGSSRSHGQSVQVTHHQEQLLVRMEESGSKLVLLEPESPNSRSLSPMHRRARMSFEASDPLPEVIECEEYTVTRSMPPEEELDAAALQRSVQITAQENDSKRESLPRDHHGIAPIPTAKPLPGHRDSPESNQFLDTSIDLRYDFLIKGEQYVPGMNHVRLHVLCPDDLYCGCGDILTPDNFLHHESMHDLVAQIEHLLMDNVLPLNENVHVKDSGAKGVSLMKPSTIRRSEKSSSRKERAKEKGRQKMKFQKVPDRDLFKSSSVQFYEVVFVYPFLESSDAALNWKALPKEKFGEIFDVLNHVAIGLGGAGLALVLLVASRMLSLNATLDSTKMGYLLRGMGLMWLSSGLKKFGLIVKQMADFCIKTRLERKEQLIEYKEKMQAISFRVCLLVILTIVG